MTNGQDTCFVKSNKVAEKNMCNTFEHEVNTALRHYEYQFQLIATLLYYGLHLQARLLRLSSLRTLNIGQSDYEITCQFGLHHITISCLIKQFSESGDPYFQKHKPGHPCKFQECDAHHGTLLLAHTEAANVTELTKQAFSHVSCITVPGHYTSMDLPHMSIDPNPAFP